MAPNDFIQTGIRGLDDIFLGGVRRGNVVLVAGAAGTGKTLLGVEFVYRGAVEFDEPGIVVSFEMSPQKIIRDAASFGWDLAALQEQKRIKIVFSSPQVLSQELRSPDSLLMETASAMGARRVFIDGIGLLRTVTNDLNVANTPSSEAMISYRELLQQLLEGLQRENLTALLSHEVTAIEQQAYCMEVTEYLVDTVLQLKRQPHGYGVQRTLEITKSRGQDYENGLHTLRINSERGLEVFRRVQAPPRKHQLPQPTSDRRRSALGDPNFDTLLGGGVLDGSVTLTIGLSGSGKSILGMQALLEGAKNQDQPGLLVSLDEHAPQILRNAASLDLDLKQQLDQGGVHILNDSPRELEVDVHFDLIVRTIEKYGIRRLVVDGVTSYCCALRDYQLYRDFFQALVDYCKSRLLITFLSYESQEIFGTGNLMPNFPISSLVDNIILLNLVEMGETLRRAVTVPKARSSVNQLMTREFVIGSGGIRVLPETGPALPTLPFSRYYGIVSRTPPRLSPDLLPRGGSSGGVVPI